MTIFDIWSRIIRQDLQHGTMHNYTINVQVKIDSSMRNTKRMTPDLKRTVI